MTTITTNVDDLDHTDGQVLTGPLPNQPPPEQPSEIKYNAHKVIPGTQYEIHADASEFGAVFGWHWYTQDQSPLTFSVIWKPKSNAVGKGSMLIIKQVQLAEHKGSWTTNGPGTLVFQWTHSWQYYSKTLLFAISSFIFSSIVPTPPDDDNDNATTHHSE